MSLTIVEHEITVSVVVDPVSHSIHSVHGNDEDLIAVFRKGHTPGSTMSYDMLDWDTLEQIEDPTRRSQVLNTLNDGGIWWPAWEWGW